MGTSMKSITVDNPLHIHNNECVLRIAIAGMLAWQVFALPGDEGVASDRIAGTQAGICEGYG
jgi:hypothetical protein